MRTTVHLQERHLAEAVRRKVITEEQYEGILGVARSMSPAENTAPDLRWVTVVHAAAAAVAVGIPAIYLLGHFDRFVAYQLLVASAVAAVASWSIGLVIRRAGLGRVPASIFTAGAAAFAWGIGAAAWIAARHGLNGSLDTLDMGEAWRVHQVLRHQAYLVGDLTAIVVALALGGMQRVPATAAVGAFAFVHLVMGTGDLLAAMHGGYFSERDANPVLIAVGVAMLVAGRVFDRVFRTRGDAAFWVHTFGLLPLGIGAAMRIDHSPAEGLIWSAVAVGVALLGIKWDRRIYLVASGAALLFYPAFALSEARVGDDVAAGAFLVSLLVIGVAAAWLRGYYTRVWIAAPARSLERTVWE